MSRATEQFGDLLAIMRRLRSPEGCPWDREQTLESLRRYLIEETYEVIDAIDRRDWTGLAEELGDLQLQVVFQAEIARSEGWFDIQAVLETINSKLVRRHPHVFESESLKTADDVTQRWEQIKRQEKPQPQGEGLLDDIPRHQPAMLEAHQAGKAAAKAGFDWQEFEDMGDKLAEEFREVCEALQASDPGRVEDEVGDLLFMAVNVARFSGVDPELALKRANSKF
ncbi:MAG: nucleoside triphosphate pyrophosphohydrolase, partial [Bryobacterales bacterium]|nr:nucleoside triphosphate pyrophosphohydrolase [Bryobacterales bacterium]